MKKVIFFNTFILAVEVDERITDIYFGEKRGQDISISKLYYVERVKGLKDGEKTKNRISRISSHHKSWRRKTRDILRTAGL